MPQLGRREEAERTGATSPRSRRAEVEAVPSTVGGRVGRGDGRGRDGRSSHPKRGVWAAAVLGFVVAVVAMIASSAWGAPHSGTPAVGSGSGGAPGYPSPTSLGLHLILSNTTIWPLATGHFESTDFTLDIQSQVWGSFAAGPGILAYIMNDSAFAQFAPGGGAAGVVVVPTSTAASLSNWVAAAGSVDMLLPAGSYHLVFADGNQSAAGVVHVTESFVSLEEDT